MSSSYSNKRTRENVLIAIFAAIIILQTWVPFLGYIALPTLSLTIIHITVIVVTLLKGTKAGVIIGAVWGINSLLRAVFIGNPIERMIFMNPLISILPRMLMPLVIGLLSNWMLKNKVSTKVRASILGFLGSLLNTVFVLGMIGLFSADQYLELLGRSSGSNIWIVLMSIVTLNGIPEAIVSTILTPILTLTLDKIVKR
ncbi:ECF transporter S component [Aerococcaceae bacterium DSM 111022]|nr:ECF transporter S component [Aerococcaceae bacterium DSM 111022]